MCLLYLNIICNNLINLCILKYALSVMLSTKDYKFLLSPINKFVKVWVQFDNMSFVNS